MIRHTRQVLTSFLSSSRFLSICNLHIFPHNCLLFIFFSISRILCFSLLCAPSFFLFLSISPTLRGFLHFSCTLLSLSFSFLYHSFVFLYSVFKQRTSIFSLPSSPVSRESVNACSIVLPDDGFYALDALPNNNPVGAINVQSAELRHCRYEKVWMSVEHIVYPKFPLHDIQHYQLENLVASMRAL